MGGNLLANYGEAVAMILFGIGFSNLLLQKNLIKKIIGLNIMDTATYLFLAEKGYIAADCGGQCDQRGGIYQSSAEWACADWNCGVGVGDGADVITDHTALQKVSHTRYGRNLDNAEKGGGIDGVYTKFSLFQYSVITWFGCADFYYEQENRTPVEYIYSLGNHCDVSSTVCVYA